MLHLSIYTLYACTSIDGSGLNTNENSKDSHPYNSEGLFSDIVQLSYYIRLLRE